MTLLIRNATCITPTGNIRGDCLIRNGKIAALGPHPTADASVKIDALIKIDASGLYLAPGFIDLQCNGAFGHDFTTDPATIWPVAAALPRFGVTSFLPTIITSPLATVAHAQAVLTQHPLKAGAIPLGLHLEGPYLNVAKKGAHNPAHLRAPTRAEVIDWSPSNGVRLVTLAPELTGADDLIARLFDNNVIVSAGHSTATFDQATAAVDAGVRYGTHVFNAMPPLHHRDPGLVGALLADERATIGLIPDGVHVHPALVKSVWQVARHRLNVVTDAMAAMGQGPGIYQLGDHTVTVDETTARLADGTLAGSIVTLDQAVRNLVQWTGCTAHEAIRTVTEIPAELLGFSQKGRVEVGTDADLVLLDKELYIQQTIINGELWGQ